MFLLRYFLIANVVGSVYGILMLFPPPKNFLWRLALVADVVSGDHKNLQSLSNKALNKFDLVV